MNFPKSFAAETLENGEKPSDGNMLHSFIHITGVKAFNYLSISQNAIQTRQYAEVQITGTCLA